MLGAGKSLWHFWVDDVGLVHLTKSNVFLYLKVLCCWTDCCTGCWSSQGWGFGGVGHGLLHRIKRCKIFWEGGVRARPGWGRRCLGLNRCILEKRHKSLILCFYLKKLEKYRSHIFVNVIFEINRVESNCWNKEGVTVMSTNRRDVNVSFDLISYLFPNIVFW